MLNYQGNKHFDFKQCIIARLLIKKQNVYINCLYNELFVITPVFYVMTNEKR